MPYDPPSRWIQHSAGSQTVWDAGRRAQVAGPGAGRSASAAGEIESRLIAWRRDIHEHPELGEQENANVRRWSPRHLTKLGLEVRTGVGRTGVGRDPQRRQARSGRGAARPTWDAAAGQGAGRACRSRPRPGAHISDREVRPSCTPAGMTRIPRS